jgi:hypothetical protein
MTTFKWICPNDGARNDDEIDDELGPFFTCTCSACGKAFDQASVEKIAEAE